MSIVTLTWALIVAEVADLLTSVVGFFHGQIEANPVIGQSASVLLIAKLMALPVTLGVVYCLLRLPKQNVKIRLLGQVRTLKFETNDQFRLRILQYGLAIGIAVLSPISVQNLLNLF